MNWNLDFITKAVNGSVLSQPHNQFTGYSTDNRAPQTKSGLFIPLVGDVHDAHRFVPAAVEAGAKAVLVHKWEDSWGPLKEKASFIKVDDTLRALQNLSSTWRDQLKGKVLGLTGSNGKTTTKDFLSQLLSQQGSTNASKGSFNNHWGLPFTLLETKEDDQFCVLEMGMNHSGEISELNKIGRPEFVMVTNVGRAHVGNFDNGIEGVAAAKEEIYQSAQPGTKFIFNIDNEWTRKMYGRYTDHPSFTFSTQNFSADVYLKVKERKSSGLLIEGQIGGVLGKAELGFWGEHNVENLAAAVTMAYMAGMSPEKLWQLLPNCHTGWGRNQKVELQSGGQVLFDAYNANPESYAKLFENLEKHWDEKLTYAGVFGEMLELGEQSEAEHESLGRLASQFNWQSVLFIGPSGEAFARGFAAGKNSIKPMILNTYEESLDLEWPFVLNPELRIIIKGSRGIGLERVVRRLDPIAFAEK